VTKPPLSDDEVEHLLHELMRQITEANGETDQGRLALRIALAGIYGSLLNLSRSNPPEPSPPQQPD
jgi:hypothetical protein